MECTLAARLAVVCLTISCVGCTALETRESQAWLALHAVDTAQTFRIADSPECFVENDSITRRLIGPRPSRSEVAAWSIGMAAMHLGVTEVLLRNERATLAKVWQYIRIGVTASAIGENHSIGIRIGSPNRPTSACHDAAEIPSPTPSPAPRPIR